MSGRPNFNQRVWALVRQVPAGQVVAYGDVASAMGSPRAARQVGRALAALGRFEPEEAVPWQRVLRKDGALAFRGDPIRCGEQRRLLLGEGVKFVEEDQVDMARHRWAPHPRDWLDPALGG